LDEGVVVGNDESSHDDVLFARSNGDVVGMEGVWAVLVVRTDFTFVILRVSHLDDQIDVDWRVDGSRNSVLVVSDSWNQVEGLRIQSRRLQVDVLDVRVVARLGCHQGVGSVVQVRE